MVSKNEAYRVALQIHLQHIIESVSDNCTYTLDRVRELQRDVYAAFDVALAAPEEEPAEVPRIPTPYYDDDDLEDHLPSRPDSRASFGFGRFAGRRHPYPPVADDEEF